MANVNLEISLNGIATITLDYPEKRNILNSSMLRQINNIVLELKSKKNEVKVLIIESSNQNFFSAGGDLREWKDYSKQEAFDAGKQGGELFASIESLPFVTIAAISGGCFGGGCELALSCDIRVATENSSFGQPEVTLGNGPSWGGYYRLARKVGISRAKEMILLGRLYSASEANQFNLIQIVVPDWVGLQDSVNKMANEIVENSEVTSISKQILTKMELEMLSNDFLTDGFSASAFAETDISINRKLNFLNKGK